MPYEFNLGKDLIGINFCITYIRDILVTRFEIILAYIYLNIILFRSNYSNNGK